MRTVFEGEEKLQKHADTAFPKSVTKICDNVYFTLGYGGSNCILVVGETSCLLIDTLNGLPVAEEALAEFRKVTDKPIKNIVYTHYSHMDHISGASAFAGDDPVIWARNPTYPRLGKTNMLKKAYGTRGAKQFGISLSAEDSICIGCGPRNDQNAAKGPLQPTKLFSEEVLECDFDGIKAVLVAAPGETDDQLFVWLPQYEALCCGDNYYASWPNLYPLRGSQYRDMNSWVESLQKMIDCNAKYLLPGHTKAVIGYDEVKEHLTNYHDAIEYVVEESLKGIAEGKTIAELVESIKLPEKYVELDYLQEYYGSVAWAVHSIYTGYLGWFDGNPTDLYPTPHREKAAKMLKVMGGAERVISEIEAAFEADDEQWAIELCDILLDAGEEVEKATELKVRGLRIIARLTVNACARHWCLVTANQMEHVAGSDVQVGGLANDAFR